MNTYPQTEEQAFTLGFRVMRLALAICGVALLAQGLLDWQFPMRHVAASATVGATHECTMPADSADSRVTAN